MPILYGPIVGVCTVEQQFLHGVTSALYAAICVVMLLLIAHINLNTIHTYKHNSYLEWPNVFDKLLNHHYRDGD